MGVSKLKLPTVLLIAAASLIVCTKKISERPNKPAHSYRNPAALIISSGDGDGAGTIGDGVLAAHEALNSLGCPTRLENRTALYEPGLLQNYDIMILPTLYGSHDADRKFSLTYLDTVAMTNIMNWVEKGGILIAGENIGRNRMDGGDRISAVGTLNENNWPLAKLFGTSFREVELSGYVFQLDTGSFLGSGWSSDRAAFSIPDAGWILVPENQNGGKDGKFWAYWQGAEKFGGAIRNNFGKGTAIYLSFSLLIHPAIDGGLSNPGEIKAFFKRVLNLATGSPDAPIVGISPWPYGKQAGLVVTLGADGSEPGFAATIDSIIQAGGVLTVFLEGVVDPDRFKDYMNNEFVELASSGAGTADYGEPRYQRLREDITIMEWMLGQRPVGFRFPRFRRSFDGLLILAQRGYLYDSSLPANHREYYEGSIFPYNIPIFDEKGRIISTNLLELSPVYLDDWAFYGDLIRSMEKAPKAIEQKAYLYESFLDQYFQNTILPEGGLMVQIGHAAFEGFSYQTLAPLLNFIRKTAADGKVWIARAKDVAVFWNQRSRVRFTVDWDGESGICRVNFGDADYPPGTTLKLFGPDGKKPVEITDGQGSELEKKSAADGTILVILTGREKDEVEVVFR
mgnify:CR=1 FL=1